jgi:hypothetical protein
LLNPGDEPVASSFPTAERLLADWEAQDSRAALRARLERLLGRRAA